MSVLALWEGRPDVPVTQSLVRLLADEAVPFLAAYRYKDSGTAEAGGVGGDLAAAAPRGCRGEGRRDRGAAEVHVGGLPEELLLAGAGQAGRAEGAVHPLPRCGRETDPTPLLGWAGWDHAQQSLALSLIIGEREKDGWDDDRLVPLVAGLAELQPWVKQWHGEVDPSYGVSLAASARNS